MKHAYKLGTATFAMSAISGFAAVLYAMVSKPSLHPLNESCASCHMADVETTTGNTAMLITSQEQLCGQCHANALKMSHPSGLTPPLSYIFPPDYPRDWKGDLTCVSCHEAFTRNHGKVITTGNSTALCFECHDL